LPVLDRCLAIRRKCLDPAHPGVIAAQIKVAEARAALGELALAERAFREVLESQRSAHPAGGRPTVVILTGLGEVLTRADRAPEAEPLLREALGLSRGMVPAGHWRHGDIASVVGACLWRVGKRDEARPLLVAGRDLLVANLGPGHPITRRAQRRLDAAQDARATR
jgi:Tetratricopeptide repeat